jgi:predicted extracellular nuclease
MGAGQRRTRTLNRECVLRPCWRRVRTPKRQARVPFVNHLKSKFVDTRGKTEAEIARAVKAGNARSAAQARYVAKLVEERFKGRHASALYAVVGDFNDTQESRALASVLQSPRLVDVLAVTREPADRWTYYWRSRGRVQQIDSSRLASPTSPPTTPSSREVRDDDDVHSDAGHADRDALR